MPTRYFCAGSVVDNQHEPANIPTKEKDAPNLDSKEELEVLRRSQTHIESAVEEEKTKTSSNTCHQEIKEVCYSTFPETSSILESCHIQQ